jgi:hypothetical protein
MIALKCGSLEIDVISPSSNDEQNVGRQTAKNETSREQNEVIL